MATSNLHFVLALVVASLIQDTGADTAYPCRGNSTYIKNSGIPACFALLDVDEGPVNASEASRKCASKFTNSEPVYVQDKRQLQFIVDFAIKEGIPEDGEAGFWTWWIRREDARLDSNGVLSQANKAIRKNRDLFASPYDKDYRPKPELWRNETQPGNTLDARDEKCTAQSRLGKQPEYLGLDDYECNGAQLHYALCQVA